ncbi:gliding motility-associated C-terminal domain-containing protein [Pontibacter locisalis]|uniref:Gliding motility-associated C-terminal domain-containing protein n=1 Tax=Pontibacter locisalis TaxID=1719035 RepID=A0ABW5IMU4_9BACT
MRSLFGKVILLVVYFCAFTTLAFAQKAPPLGAAHEYHALAEKKVTNKKSKEENLRLGVANGSVSGLSRVAYSRRADINNNASRQAIHDARLAYDNALRQPSIAVTSWQKDFNPGVYKVNGTAAFNGIVSLNDAGQAAPVFIFQVPGDLSISDRTVLEYAQKVSAENIVWVVDGDLTIGKNAKVAGTFLAKGKITLGDGARLNGRVVSLNNQVVLGQAVLNTRSDLSVAISISPSASGTSSYLNGEEVDIFYRLTNNGPADETGAIMRNISFTGDFISSSSSVQGANYNAQQKEWNVRNLASGETATLTLRVRLSRAGLGIAQAFVEGINIDENIANNSASITYCVLMPSTGTITGSQEVCVGRTYDYSIEPVSGATRYTWTVPAGWSYTQITDTQIRVTPTTVTTPSSPAVISVQTSNICGDSPAQTINVASTADRPEQPGAITGPTAVCAQTQGLTYSVAAVPNATSYIWTLPEGAGWAFAEGTETDGNSITVTAGTAGGTITVVAVNACGMSDVTATTVAVSVEAPTVSVIRGAVDPCVGRTVTYEIDAVANALEYLWDVPGNWAIMSGQNTNSITVTVGSDPIVISVAVRNACETSQPRTISVTPTLDVPPVPGAITGPENVCAGKQGLTYSINPVAGAKSYVWEIPADWKLVSANGGTSITVDAGTAASGTIAVKAINSCGEGTANALAIEVTPSVPAAPGAITGNQLVCAGQKLTYSIAPVSGATSYSWIVPGDWRIESGEGTNSIEVTAGTDNVTIAVKAVNVCGEGDASALEVISQNAVPVAPVFVSKPAEVCEGKTGLIYSVTPVDGVSAYNWQLPTGWSIESGEGTASITVTASSTGLTQGTVSVTLTNECGTGPAASTAVKIENSVPDQPAAINGKVSACINEQNITYSIDPVANATSYRWAGTNGWTVTTGQGSTNVTVTAGTANGTISVVAVNVCGDGVERQLAVSVSNDVPAMPAAITGMATPCVGREYTYTISEVADALGYTWSKPADWRVVEENGTTFKVIAGSDKGTISVTANNSCGSSTAQTLAVTPTAEAPAGITNITGTTRACVGDVLTFSVNASANAVSYAWNVPADWTELTGQGTTQISVRAGATTGPVSLTATNECGEVTISKTVAISTTAPGTPGAITAAPALLCEGAVATFTIEEVAGADSYAWNFPSDWMKMGGTDARSIQVKVGKSAGDATVKAINSCGSSTESTLAVAPQPSTLVAPAAITASEPVFCQNATNLNYSIPSVEGATKYEWNVPAGWLVTSGSGTTAIVVNAGSEGGNITVTASNECGATVSKSLAVQPNKAPMAVTITGPVTPCAGEAATYSVAAEAGVTFTWNFPSGWTMDPGQQGNNTVTVTPSATAGPVSVVASNDCGTNDVVELQVQPTNGVPAAPGAITGTAKVCAGQTITYTAGASAGATSYVWTLPQGWALVPGTPANTTQIQVIAGSNPGTISVVAKNSCGNSASTTKALDAKVLVVPTAIVDSSSPCVGLVYEVTPTAGTTYNWTLPTGWSIASGAGTNKITVTAAAGATSTGTVSVVADNGNCASQPVSIIAYKDLANSVLELPNVFSPNNDGNNDTWRVKNLENYPDNDLTIINRWGNEVFKAKTYNNGWTGDGLSEGTYFYMLRVKMCDGSDKVFKGYVMIVR